MSYDDRYAPRAQTETEAAEDSLRGKAMAERLYPDKRMDEMVPYVARKNGPVPDLYNEIAFAVFNEYLRVLKEKCNAQLFGVSVNGGTHFSWDNVRKEATVEMIDRNTVSLGSGRGRKEGVELGKSNPPVQPVSRWALRRRQDR